ncbi:uncharacterized protein LOC100906116 [Galendromus occidentalis]|uniref:Uncharacterized protein LOC100906116 n=1 Tax=Galendromus occidentalis TaxID=34638 RepID=A0AAJ6QQH9_9ACAR|nr:uncharacterized protein LOC100906116 [Galendromus occidentalis]
MKFVLFCLVFSAALVQVCARAAQPCSCSNKSRGLAHSHNGTRRGCSRHLELLRLQIGRVTAPGKMHFKYKLRLTRPLYQPRVDFTISKGVKLPCFGGYGSCSYSLCGFNKYPMEERICSGWGCECPVQSGIYNSGLMSVDLPDLRGLGRGAYGPVEVEVRFRERNRVIHCTKFKILVHRPRKRSTSLREIEFQSRDLTDVVFI